MAKATFIENVTVFDGRTVRRKQGVLFDEAAIRWIGAAGGGGGGEGGREGGGGGGWGGGGGGGGEGCE
jgi:hypothetical protein